MSYIEKRIARKMAESPEYRAGFEEEEALLAQELERRQQVMTVIAELRKAQHLSQQQLAARLKVSQARVSQMERGKESLSIDSVLQMVDALHGGIVVLSPDEIARLGLEHRLVSNGETIGKYARNDPSRRTVIKGAATE